MRYESVDPTTGHILASYSLATSAEVEGALADAWHTFTLERAREPAERVQRVERLAALLAVAAPALAQRAAEEMGKPLAEGETEARKCAAGCRWFAQHAPALLAPEKRTAEQGEAQVRFDPLGPVLALMPWNFPFWQVIRATIPALIAGNTVLLKHAPSTPGCARALERLFREAGFAPGAFRSLFLSNPQAAAVIADPRVRGVTLTGSTRAGKEVAALAARALKPCVLELGGSDPFVVFADADLAEAAKTAVLARCQNAGQSCIAAKRFLVERGAYERFVTSLCEGMRARKMGAPTDAGVDLGPLARQDLRDTLAEQVRATLAAGGRVLCGGEVPEGPGWFYPPTVLVDVPPGSPADREELFGPVAVVGAFDSEEQAIAQANGTAYGLGASVWTSDAARAERMATALEAGSVFVNGQVRSDPRLPFGGVKDSGQGRELGLEGLRAFTNVKTVWRP
jgi:succinate-semialdehyde dehydrogenase / glutarate-semialdehyde dehydrogenase